MDQIHLKHQKVQDDFNYLKPHAPCERGSQPYIFKNNFTLFLYSVFHLYFFDFKIRLSTGWVFPFIYQIVYIKFIGIHKQYEEIKAESI
jgi:hypothetical protein